MRAIKKQLQQNMALLLFSGLISALPVMAATNLEAQESFANARANNHQQNADQAEHANHIDKTMGFHGVFYGFLPCADCQGIKTTLSLKQNNNYLLVTQPAKESSREFYEKGKYTWNDENKTVVLTPNKGGTTPRHYQIEGEGKLVQLNADGSKISAEAERYVLQRSDTVKSREVHIH